MEMSFSEIRTKEVVNTADGKKLGKVCDMVFCYPENRILGFVVPGSRAFGLKKSDFFIELKNIVKIGEDVILVNVGCAGSQGGKGKGVPRESPTMGMPYGGMPCGTPTSPQSRRSYEEYE
jgi:YlmC/YmxH family sporulation protein